MINITKRPDIILKNKSDLFYKYNFINSIITPQKIYSATFAFLAFSFLISASSSSFCISK